MTRFLKADEVVDYEVTSSRGDLGRYYALDAAIERAEKIAPRCHRVEVFERRRIRVYGEDTKEQN